MLAVLNLIDVVMIANLLTIESQTIDVHHQHFGYSFAANVHQCGQSL